MAALIAVLAEVHRVDRYPVNPARVSPDWISGQPGDRSWVAELSGHVVGHVTLARTDLGPMVQRLFVSPTARERGIASALLDIVEAHDGPIRLEVDQQAPKVIALYEARGWRRIGERPGGWTTVDGSPAQTYIYEFP